MSMSRPGAIPKVPTLPAGDEVAAFATYLQAQQAVDYLSDNKFAVENVTIVGTDLRMVERVTGRLTYGRVALAGALSGAWFGLFVGLLLTFFAGGEGGGVLFVGIGLGAGFGLLFSVLSYAFTRGRRDFTSSSQIVAATYAILCSAEHAGEARSMLLESPSGVGRPSAGAGSVRASGVQPMTGAGTSAPVASAEAPSADAEPGQAQPQPSPPDPRFLTAEGKPRYGAMRPESGSGPAAESESQPGSTVVPEARPHQETPSDTPDPER